jgi:tripartite-type tricarboxylate transporter receptor subunit TctC
LNCSSIEFVVPNAPGGGSDQQARFLEPGLSEFFGIPVNVVYRQGAGGSIAWLDLRDRAPDGCTVANVVYPNIALSQEQDETGLLKSDEFVHITQTWAAPQTIAVKIDETRWQTAEEFLAFVLANPGRVTVGGTGRNGEVFQAQILAATGAQFTYVPMSGGVGDTIPLLAGGSLDAAMFASSHVENNKELIRGLAVAGSQRNPSPSLRDIPTFEELGYQGVTMSTTFGVMAPPGMSAELTALWSEAIAFAINDELLARLPELGLTPLSPTPAEAQEFNRRVLADFGLS